MRDLIRRDLARDTIDQVDQLLIDGINSGPAEPMNAAWRNARRAALAKHVRARAARLPAREPSLTAGTDRPSTTARARSGLKDFLLQDARVRLI